MNAHSDKPDLSGLRINRDQAPTAQARHPAGKRFLWIVSILIVVAAAVVLIVKGSRTTVAVETATVQRLAPAATQSLLTATGYVVAQRKAAVASKGTGRLEILNVEEGDRVAAGDIIGRLESADVEAAQRAAQAAVDQAKAVLAQAEALRHEAQVDFDRVSGLRAHELASQSDFDKAEARHRTAVANVEATEAALRRSLADLRWAEVQVENTYIRAPFDGTVLTKNADVGEVVAPFAASASSRGALVTLADMGSLEVEADVSESNIRKIIIGQPCLITLDALPAEPYTGAVKKIVPTADRAKATVLTKIVFDQLDERVLPEMSAKVNFLPAGDSAAGPVVSGTVLAVPAAAVTTRDGRTVVFRVQDEQVSAVPVERGASFGALTEVQGDLQAGDVIVAAPSGNLADGDHVTIKK
ncbi:MAG TPA: efflux RND transporter periplasmic adaptor subunit [Acidobacteriota bacterium]|nr:efflux RND transporter periplasmic adaptor subunit [Acidobacteriota bacterium]